MTLIYFRVMFCTVLAPAALPPLAVARITAVWMTQFLLIPVLYALALEEGGLALLLPLASLKRMRPITLKACQMLDQLITSIDDVFQKAFDWLLRIG